LGPRYHVQFKLGSVGRVSGLMGLLEDNQSLGREACHVPIFGFPYYVIRVTLGGLSQSSQRDDTMSSVSSEGLDDFYGTQLSLFTVIHHHDYFCTTYSWFRCIPTIFVKRGY
jgi:hypothetical protein